MDQTMEMRQEQMQTQDTKKAFNKRLTFYHPNTKGTGTAIQLELRMNRVNEDRYDCFFLEMAHQKSNASGTTGQRRTPATFDWTNKVTVKLDFMDICEFLCALEGKKPQAGNGKGGIYHEAGGANTLISLSRNEERGGYYLGVSKKNKQDGESVFKGHILLTESEALGLRHVFQTSLFFLVFRQSIGVSPE